MNIMTPNFNDRFEVSGDHSDSFEFVNDAYRDSDFDPDQPGPRPNCQILLTS